MPNVEIVVLGDSVTWGQGLLDSQKMHNLVAAAFNGGTPANVTLLAHSGAIIGAGVETTAPAVDGEVPVSYPTIIQQCTGFTGDTQQVDIVIVNGGINDVDFHVIVNPLTDPGDLYDSIVQYCYADMKTLLSEVLAKFPNPKTQIVLTSYYPILSRQSAMELIPGFLLLHGVTTPPFLVPIDDLAFDRPVTNCLQFWTESNVVFQRAVAEINGTQPGAPRIFFAKVPFGEENAVFGPQEWLWGVNADFSSQDPVQTTRRAACAICEKDLIQRETCYRASAGHPNVVGAQQFADEICAVLGKPKALAISGVNLASA
jgi:hypothetical protein